MSSDLPLCDYIGHNRGCLEMCATGATWVIYTIGAENEVFACTKHVGYILGDDEEHHIVAFNSEADARYAEEWARQHGWTSAAEDE